MKPETKETKLDQRVILTRKLLKDSLVHQMQTQHISKISVRLLCEGAGLNRSTFYAHYADQYALLESVEKEALQNLTQYLQAQDFSNNVPLSEQVLNRILEYVKSDSELFKALLSENCDFTFQKDILTVAQIISGQINRNASPRIREYLELFGITGCINVLQKWLHDGMIESTSTMSDLILRVIYQGFSSFQ